MSFEALYAYAIRHAAPLVDFEREAEIRQIARRGIEIHADRIHVEKVWHQNDHDHEHGQRVLLNAIIRSSCLSVKDSAMMLEPSSGGIGMRLKNTNTG